MDEAVDAVTARCASAMRSRLAAARTAGRLGSGGERGVSPRLRSRVGSCLGSRVRSGADVRTGSQRALHTNAARSSGRLAASITTHVATSITTRSAASHASSKQNGVREIAHTSTHQAKNSCGLICLRVKTDLKFGCSMRWSNKRQSITELNSDSHSKKQTVENNGRQDTKTFRSCGSAASASPEACKVGLHHAPAAASSLNHCNFLLNAGLEPAFDQARLSHKHHELARRAEFISVSGSRAARSALRSDLRLKRTSGPVAATPQLHAPMNSPDPRAWRDRVSINLNAIA